MSRIEAAAVVALGEAVRAVIPTSVTPFLNAELISRGAERAAVELERRGFVLVSITEFDQTVSQARAGQTVERAERIYSEAVVDVRALLNEVVGMRNRMERHLAIIQGVVPTPTTPT